jgi:predicted RNA-binding protein with TRAM domain
MVHVPDELQCLFSARVREQDDGYVVRVPKREVEQGSIESGAVYRVAAFGGETEQSVERPSEPPRSTGSTENDHPTPPVEEGEVRTVTVETTGDQGDGIAKVERGYVVIVQEGEPGEQVTVEMSTVRENFAIAHIVE